MSLLLCVALCCAEAEEKIDHGVRADDVAACGMVFVERSDKRLTPIKFRPAQSFAGAGGFGGSAFSTTEAYMEKVDFDENRWPKKLPAFGAVVYEAVESAPLLKGDVVFVVDKTKTATAKALQEALAVPGAHVVQFQRYNLKLNRWEVKSMRAVVP